MASTPRLLLETSSCSLSASHTLNTLKIFWIDFYREQGERDRAAAWYEIRFGSNRERNKGLQNRRDRESTEFGLYNAEPTAAETQEVRAYLDQGIHDECRRQGCLPGWLR